MSTNALLESHLKSLRLPTFIENYETFAQDATQQNLSFERYLLALAEQEVSQREINRQQLRIRQARFPVIKSLSDFDFSAIPQLNKQRLLDLARGEYLHRIEPIILVGNPGLGKTHMATGLALAACYQGYRVRFYNAAALVNDLIEAQQEGRLTKFLNTALKQTESVLGSLADRIRVSDQFVGAIESAMGHHLHLVLTEHPESARQIVRDLHDSKQGRASIAPL